MEEGGGGAGGNFNEGAPEIMRDEIQFDPNDKKSMLGEGSFGSVWKGKCRGFTCAVKVPNKKLTPEQTEEFKAEIRIMSKLFNPRIALFMGAYIPEVTGEPMIIVSEMLHGDMKTMLAKDAKKKQYSLYQRMLWAKQAAEGMTWLHGAGVIHRDFKPSNLLWDKNTNTVKVCDFGLSALVPRGDGVQGEAKGTPLYVAPEMVQGGDTTHAADVYSYGIAMSVFVTREAPFQHHTDLTAFLEAVCYDNERPALPEDPFECPDSLVKLCEDCWQAEPENRPTFEQILDRFDREILIDSAIFDPLGRVFWRKRFLHPKDGLREDVAWSEFIQTFNSSFGSRDYDMESTQMYYGECMKELFAKRVQGKLRVTLPHFGNMLGFFNPLVSGGSWVGETCSVMSKPWFWGDTDGNNAHRALSTAPPGTYLIRFSSTPSNYTISFRQGGQVWHTRINHSYQGKSFVLDTTASEGKAYKTLAEIITSMTSMKDGLQKAAEGGPYSRIFNDDSAELGGYAKVESGYE